MEKKSGHIWAIIYYLTISILGPCGVTPLYRAQLQYKSNEEKFKRSRIHGKLYNIRRMAKAGVKGGSEEEKWRRARITKNRIEVERASVCDSHTDKLLTKINMTFNGPVVEILKQ